MKNLFNRGEALDVFYVDDVECLQYLRKKLAYLIDLRVKDKLRIKPSITKTYLEPLDELLDFFVFDTFKRDWKDNYKSPIVKYYASLYGDDENLFEVVLDARINGGLK